jgi:hypothetical protein
MPKNRTSLLIGLYTIVVFLLTYWWNPSRPGITSPLGWYQDWADQTAYYSMTSSIPGNLGTFQYPVIYPLMGYLGRFLWPSDPFLLVDLLLFTAFIWLSWRNFCTFLPPAVALVGACVLVHISVILFVQPWSSSVAAAGIALLLYRYLYKLYSLRWGLVSGVTLALIFGARPQDAVAAALILALCLLNRQHNEFPRWILAASLSIAVIIPAILWTNYHFSHLLLGPYFARGMAQGFHPANIPRNLYGYFLDAWKYDHDHLSRPVFQVCPLLLLAPIGLAYLITNRETRRIAFGYIASATGWFIVYSAFYSVKGDTLLYGSIHYVKALFPIFLGCGIYALYCLGGGSESPKTRFHEG